MTDEELKAAATEIILISKRNLNWMTTKTRNATPEEHLKIAHLAATARISVTWDGDQP